MIHQKAVGVAVFVATFMKAMNYQKISLVQFVINRAALLLSNNLDILTNKKSMTFSTTSCSFLFPKKYGIIAQEIFLLYYYLSIVAFSGLEHFVVSANHAIGIPLLC